MRRRTALVFICLAGTALIGGCSANPAPRTWGPSLTPDGGWKVSSADGVGMSMGQNHFAYAAPSQIQQKDRYATVPTEGN